MPSKLDDLLAVRPTSYWANSGILSLNAILIVAQISSYATGYDGSMMNGLQCVDLQLCLDIMLMMVVV
jgi:hypothetical protein